MDKLSILIIEDNPSDIMLIKEYLSENQHFEYEIREAETLEAAFGLISHFDFDVVLLDLTLPDSSGLDTVRSLITKMPDIALIVLTGVQDEETALLSVRYGAQDYLEKQSLTPALLAKSIMYSIERKKSFQGKEELLNDLTQALKRIAALENNLPLCLSCKRILDENERWQSIEDYALQHAEKEPVQMICPDCKSDLEQE